ncbi:MAG: hypothetical protein MMC23_003116 [Stictis urceolatum]|nr:hypothetical protein [Stictis urceolata]
MQAFVRQYLTAKFSTASLRSTLTSRPLQLRALHTTPTRHSPPNPHTPNPKPTSTAPPKPTTDASKPNIDTNTNLQPPKFSIKDIWATASRRTKTLLLMGLGLAVSAESYFWYRVQRRWRLGDGEEGFLGSAKAEVRELSGSRKGR